jgi:ATP-dependent helicase YprA (DUF1998 family)
VVAISQTGSGKTLAFAVPALAVLLATPSPYGGITLADAASRVSGKRQEASEDGVDTNAAAPVAADTADARDAARSAAVSDVSHSQLISAFF